MWSIKSVSTKIYTASHLCKSSKSQKIYLPVSYQEKVSSLFLEIKDFKFQESTNRCKSSICFFKSNRNCWGQHSSNHKSQFTKPFWLISYCSDQTQHWMAWQIHQLDYAAMIYLMQQGGFSTFYQLIHTDREVQFAVQ